MQTIPCKILEPRSILELNKKIIINSTIEVFFILDTSRQRLLEDLQRDDTLAVEGLVFISCVPFLVDRRVITLGGGKSGGSRKFFCKGS